MLSPVNLIATARILFDSALQETDPEQAQSHLKRAVSTAYYAMFHAICASIVELLPNASTDPATSAAWLQAYRGLEHTHARNQCRNSGLMAPFPTAVREFARIFVENQGHRNQADYNPLFDFSRRMFLKSSRKQKSPSLICYPPQRSCAALSPSQCC